MNELRTLSTVVITSVVVACGPAEIRIDQTKGVPPVKGSTEIALGASTCGQPITTNGETVTTRAVSGGCELTYDRDVPVLKTTDYQSIPELKGVTTNLVQRVELTISKLAFIDADTNVALDVNQRVGSVVLAINGQQAADLSALSSLPKVISLQGEALSPLKSAIDARAAASVNVRVVVVMLSSPPPPAKLKIEYEAQPAIVLGPGKIL